MAQFGLSQSERIKKRREFVQFQKNGKKIYTKHFVLVLSPRVEKRPRIGITVTTRISKRANVRNKIKRMVRELFRTRLKFLLTDFDVIVLARDGANHCSSAEFQDEILAAVKRAPASKLASPENS